jgi:diacylglycerol kinase family enzyme
MTKQKIALILNDSSGLESDKADILKLLELPENSIFTVVRFDSKNIRSSVSKLASEGYTSIVAVGGDGTVSAVAGTIIELGLQKRGIKLGVLPTGTFNHFAKDLGIPSSIAETLNIIRKEKSVLIDVGKVNDMYFVNNSSLGIYPKIVKIRDRMKKNGYGKTIALVAASISALRTDNSLSIEFESENNKVRKITPFVFIGNNKYEISGFNIGERKRLDEGSLTICITKQVSKFRLIVLACKAIIGTLIESTDFNVIGLKEFTIYSKASLIDVSHDGEVSKINTPLHYQILPKIISVIIP